ncbi:MAG: hypothetical protein R2911_34300 [Caldilineaceae bacterium]
MQLAGACSISGWKMCAARATASSVEMACLSEKLGYRIIELPIHFEDRRIGKSKLDIPVKLESAWRMRNYSGAIGVCRRRCGRPVQPRN